MERRGGGDSIERKGARPIVGCAGWSSFRPSKIFGQDWKSRFSSVLNAYAQLFSFVEVNSTFYRLPRVSTVERWRREGKGAAFSLKAPREITHVRQFKGVEEVTDAFLEIAHRLEAFFLLFQTPKSFKFSQERLELLSDYFSSLPSQYLYGVELRGWSDEEVKALLDRTDLVHVVDPFEREALRGEPYYFRLHGSPPGPRMYSYKYTDEDLEWLKEKVMGLEGEVYIVFNNVWMCEDALRFKALLGASPQPGNPP